jgi:hypothetical protein
MSTYHIRFTGLVGFWSEMMFRNIRFSSAVACGVGALALVTLASGATYAATRTAPVSTITACVHKSGGGFYKAAKCASGDSKLTWNIKGQPGPKGKTGPAGAAYYVRSNENGDVFQHSSGVKVTNPERGVYEVNFPVNISKCAAVVSQGEESRGGFVPGTFYLAQVQSDATGGDGSPRQVNVYPTNAAGDPVAAGFDLILAC